ncbi:hypothetical protein ACFWAK_02800 [Streptomyces sp. NPDC059918]
MSLYTAADSHTIHFHQLQRGTAAPIPNRRVIERTGKEMGRPGRSWACAA